MSTPWKKVQVAILEDVISFLGSKVSLAKELGITKQTLNRYWWLERQLPLEHYIKIHEIIQSKARGR